MQVAYGGLQIAANTTPSLAPATAAKHTQGWAAIAAAQHGAQEIAASVANSRLTLVPGVYLVVWQASLETEDISGTSGDGIGDVTLQIARGGTVVAGTRARMNHQNVDRLQSATALGLIEITQAQADASTNYVEPFIQSGDASGNDVTVREGQFFALKLS